MNSKSMGIFNREARSGSANCNFGRLICGREDGQKCFKLFLWMLSKTPGKAHKHWPNACLWRAETYETPETSLKQCVRIGRIGIMQRGVSRLLGPLWAFSAVIGTFFSARNSPANG